MRAHTEREKFGHGPWNCQTNEDTLQAFWQEGIRRMGNNESIVTIGMRGDEPMPEGTEIALPEKIVADQRKIIDRKTAGADTTNVGFIWVQLRATTIHRRLVSEPQTSHR